MKKWLKRLLVFCVAVLFCSGTLRWAMLPKVIVQKPQSGFIEESLSPSDIRFSAQAEVMVSVPITCKSELTLQTWLVQPWSRVLQGQPLAQVEPAEGARALAEREQEYADAQAALSEYALAWKRIAAQYEAALLEAQKRYKSRKSDQNQAALSQAEEDYDLVVTQGIWQGTTLALEQAACTRLQEEVDWLKALDQSAWQVVSPVDGFLRQEAAEKTVLQGGDSIAAVLPSEGSVELTLTLAKLPTITADTRLIIGSTQQQTAESVTVQGTTLRAEFASFPEAIMTNGSPEIVLRGQWYTTIVPLCSVTEDNKVYTVLTREGWLGPEHYLSQTEVTLDASDGTFAAIMEGVWRDSQVVVGTDRTLKDGMRVWIVQ